MGVVHLGAMETPAGTRQVAIKRLLTKDEATENATARLVNEARLVFQLTHANICQVLDLGQNEQGTFVVMEFVPGLDLHSLLGKLKQRGQRLELKLALHVAREIAQALDYAHRRTDASGRALALVHGDVTPKNILLSEEGEVKLADFGIARAMRAIAPGNMLRAGTPGFMAPEALSAEVDHRADIYSLGVTLYVALGGPSPKDHPIDPKLLLSFGVPADVAAIVEHATLQRKQDRFLSAAVLERAIASQLARRAPDFTPSMLGELVRARAQAAPADAALPTLATIASMGHSGSAAVLSRNANSSSALVGTEKHDPRYHRPRKPLLIGALAVMLLGGLFAARSMHRVPAPANVAPAAPPVSAAPAPTSIATSEMKVVLPGESDAPRAEPRRSRGKPPVKSKLSASGFLTVSSVPWGAVYLNGKRIAEQTPAYKLEVPPGKYEVMIYSPVRKTYSPPQRVVIAPGSARVLGFQW